MPWWSLTSCSCRCLQLWSLWSSLTPTQMFQSMWSFTAGHCTPYWVEPVFASRPSTLWGGCTSGMSARVTAAGQPGTTRLSPSPQQQPLGSSTHPQIVCFRFAVSSEKRLKVHQSAVSYLGLACYTKGSDQCQSILINLRKVLTKWDVVDPQEHYPACFTLPMSFMTTPEKEFWPTPTVEVRTQGNKQE